MIYLVISTIIPGCLALESPLDSKEIWPVHSKGDQPWDFFGGTDAEGETPVLWPPHAKSWLIGKDSDAGRDWGQEEKGTTKDEMAGWHHWLNACESEWTLGVGDGQGGLAVMHGVPKSRPQLSDWTELRTYLGNATYIETTKINVSPEGQRWKRDHYRKQVFQSDMKA